MEKEMTKFVPEEELVKFAEEFDLYYVNNLPYC